MPIAPATSLLSHPAWRKARERGLADGRASKNSPKSLEAEAGQHETSATLRQKKNKSAAFAEHGYAAGLRQAAGEKQAKKTKPGRDDVKTGDYYYKEGRLIRKQPSPADLERMQGPVSERAIAQMERDRARSRFKDLSVPQAQRDKAKSAGLTFPGSDSYPLAGPDGTFSRAMAAKAVRMVGLGNVGSKPAIRRWLTAKLRANGAADLVPKEWSS